MNRILIGLVLALTLALGLLGWRVSVLADQKAALVAAQETLLEAQERAVASLKRAQRALGSREAENRVQARKLADAQSALSAALQSENEWSDTHVPPEVQNALGGALSGLPERVQHNGNPEGDPSP